MSSSPQLTVVEHETLPEYFQDGIRIKFVDDEEKIFPQDKIILTDSKSSEFFGLTSIGKSDFRYGKDNTDFKNKLTAIAHDLQLDLEFVHVRGDGSCLFRSFAKQLGLPEESFFNIKRLILKEYFSHANEVANGIAKSIDFNSSDTEHFADLIKFLGGLWTKCKADQSSLNETSELAPLTIILDAIDNEKHDSAKTPEGVFPLFKAVISCVFGDNSPIHKVCICFLSLSSNCMHYLNFYSLLFKCLDKYTKVETKNKNTRKLTRDVDAWLEDLLAMQEHILCHCRAETKRWELAIEITAAATLPKWKRATAEKKYNVETKSSLIKSIDDWDSIIKGAFNTKNAASIDDIVNSLRKLSKGFMLCTDTAVLHLMYLQSSNFSRLDIVPAAATALERQIRVFHYFVHKDGIQSIFNPKKCLDSAGDAAGNCFFFSYASNYLFINLFN